MVAPGAKNMTTIQHHHFQFDPQVGDELDEITAGFEPDPKSIMSIDLVLPTATCDHLLPRPVPGLELVDFRSGVLPLPNPIFLYATRV